MCVCVCVCVWVCVCVQLNCKDIILNGRITYDARERAVDYRCGYYGFFRPASQSQLKQRAEAPSMTQECMSL